MILHKYSLEGIKGILMVESYKDHNSGCKFPLSLFNCVIQSPISINKNNSIAIHRLM